MAGKFSVPRFGHEDLESTQELPQLSPDFESISEPIPKADPLAPYQSQKFTAPGGDFAPDDDYDPDEDLPDDFIDTMLDALHRAPVFFSRHWKKLVAAVLAIILVVVIIVVASLTRENSDPYDSKILNNVMVADVLVGGMTKDQATAALNASLGNAYMTQSMVIDLGEQIIRLEPAETGVKLNIQAAVDAAYSYGRTGTDAEKELAYQTSLSSNYILAVLPYLDLNEDFIRQTLEQIATDSISTLTQPSYALEGQVDSLSTEIFNPAASGQSIVITMGTPQVDFDAESIYEMVIDAYSLGQFRVEAPGPVVSQEPGTLDLDAIYQEFFLEPKAPTLNMTDFTTIPGSYGREFDLDAAKQMLFEADYGDTIRISLTYPAPEGDPTDVLYRDTLGKWSTNIPNDSSWMQNLRLAVQAINGVKLNPGETFSFNATVGQRSENRGYQAAPSCEDANSIAVGNGICQAASTVYVAALLSDLEVINRTAHGGPISYTEWGLDAKVDWDGTDMSFRNSGIYPIRIDAEISGSKLTVSIIGTDNRSYRTEMVVTASESTPFKTVYREFEYGNSEGYNDGDVIQEGKDGSLVKTYRHRYDKESGDLVGRDYIATSNYPSQDKLVARVAPPVVEVPTNPPSETIDVPDAESGSVEAVG